MSGQGPLIDCRDLGKTYPMGEGSVAALRGVTVAIAAGEYVAVTGASGSGKSTFMNLLGGLDLPSTGSLRFEGQPLHELDDAGLARYRNASVGFVFQQFNLLPRANALENVALPLLYAGIGPRQRRERAAACLARLGLADRAAHLPRQLSGGQQQRVAIARAIANAPRLLLADEPTGALDSRTSAEVMDLFEGLNAEGITLVVVTHEPDIAARARRRLVFRDGALIEDGA